MVLNLKTMTFYTWFSAKMRTLMCDSMKKSVPRTWKMWTFRHGFLKKAHLPWNLDLYASSSEKKLTATLEMWTFTHHFLKKVDLDLKIWTFYAWFSEICEPLYACDFLNKVDLDLKNVKLYAWFPKKSRPQPEKCGLLRVFFWKSGPLH